MEFQYERDRIFAVNALGALVAEITFPHRGDCREIDHTFVDDSLRGQGVAALLVEAAAQTLRSRGDKARVTCSYAKGWFAQRPEYGDILL